VELLMGGHWQLATVKIFDIKENFERINNNLKFINLGDQTCFLTKSTCLPIAW